jgi:hypothetical protein
MGGDLISIAQLVLGIWSFAAEHRVVSIGRHLLGCDSLLPCRPAPGIDGNSFGEVMGLKGPLGDEPGQGPRVAGPWVRL